MMMMHSPVAVIFVGMMLMASEASPPPPPQYNVVFMVMDDARPAQRYAYGQNDVFTPNMDRLAQSGLVFRRAYVVHTNKQTLIPYH